MKRNYTFLIYALLFLVMTISACSKKEGENITSTETVSISPIDNSLMNETVSPTEPIIQDELASQFTSHEANDKVIKSLNTKAQKKASTKKEDTKVIAIDAGHQSKGNSEKEPIGPGSNIMKAKVSSGTQGKYTGVAEYKLNLAISLKVKKELIKRGYKVYMIRETNQVNLSNKERAEMANESDADIFIRIHADSSTDTKVHGTSTLYPSKRNPFVAKLHKDSFALSKAIVDAMCDSTGARNRGAIARDDMSGINWCKIPVSIIEMGYMSNKEEDNLMQTKKYQAKIVKGICDGIDKFYE